MNHGFVFMFPVFTLLPMDRPGPLRLTAGRELFVPVFTDADAVRTFLERSPITECRVLALADGAALAEFLRSPLLRTARCGPEKVLVDPKDPGPGWMRVFDRRTLIAALSGAS
jgi:hypothetical protein